MTHYMATHRPFQPSIEPRHLGGHSSECARRWICPDFQSRTRARSEERHPKRSAKAERSSRLSESKIDMNVRYLNEAMLLVTSLVVALLAVLVIHCSYGDLFLIPEFNSGSMAAKAIAEGRSASPQGLVEIFAAIGEEIASYQQRIRSLSELARMLGVALLLVAAVLISSVWVIFRRRRQGSKESVSR